MMEQNENADQLLKDLFSKASKDDLSITVDQIESNLTAQDANVSGNVLMQYKYWLLGGACVILSIAVFMLSRRHTENTKASIENVSSKSPVASSQQNKSETKTINSDEINNSKSGTVTSSSEENNTIAAQNPTSNKITGTPTKVDDKKARYYFNGDATINFEYDHKKINMIIGDKVKQLKIDGETISEQEYSNYNTIINKGINMRKESDLSDEKNTDADNLQKEKNRQIMDGLVKQLQTDKLIDEAGHFEFRLTGTQVLLDNNVLDESIFTKYKKIYEKLSGIPLNEKSNIRIKH